MGNIPGCRGAEAALYFFFKRVSGGNMNERKEIHKDGVRTAQMSEKAKEVF
jgi:hypothetical protein